MFSRSPMTRIRALGAVLGMLAAQGVVKGTQLASHVKEDPQTGQRTYLLPPSASPLKRPYPTDWTGRRTGAREAARALRQHIKAGHFYTPEGWATSGLANGKLHSTRCESWQPAHPHSAKPAPGTR